MLRTTTLDRLDNNDNIIRVSFSVYNWSNIGYPEEVGNKD